MKDIMELTDYLTEFKQYTITLIDCIEKEQYDLLEGFLLKREEVIDKINKLQYTKEQFSEICNELELLEITKKIESLMIAHRNKLKKEMDSFSNTKSAHKSYTSGVRIDSLYFNKKI
jgi:hypothetical protein